MTATIYCDEQKQRFSLTWDNSLWEKIDGWRLHQEKPRVIDAVVAYLIEQGFQWKEYSGKNGYSLCLERGEESVTVSKVVDEYQLSRVRVGRGKRAHEHDPESFYNYG